MQAGGRLTHNAEATARHSPASTRFLHAEVFVNSATSHVRPRVIKLWYQTDLFLGGLVLGLLLLAVTLTPAMGSLSGWQWLGVTLYLVLCAAPMVITTLDRHRPPLVGTVTALAFFAVAGAVFYRYSGAQWELLGIMFFNKQLLFEVWPLLLDGLWNSTRIFLVSALLSVTVAPVVAVIRTLDNPIFNCIIDWYVDVFRALPILVLVIFIYYALPFLEIHSSPFAAGTWGLFLSALAFMIEYFRAGIESVSRGHVEAARSLGLGVVQTMRFVVLPLATRVVLPPLTGHLVGLFKATAFVSVVGMPELLKRAMEIVEWKANPTPLVTITIIYLVILLPLMYGSTILERRLGRWTAKPRA